MLHFFFFTSTNKADNNPQITVISRNEVRARRLAKRKFVDYGYVGKPKRLTV